MKICNLLLLALVWISLISVAGAEVQTLGIDYNLNQCVSLMQTCADCTYVNLTSVVLPNSTILNYNALMTKQGTTYNYSFCLTDQLGTYTYNTLGDPNGIITSQPVNFVIGKTFNVSQSITSGILYILLILIFIGSVYLFITIPYNNPRTPEGEIIGVDFKKYFKIGMLGLGYICLLGLIYFSWSLAYGVLKFTEMANFFFMLYKFLFIAMFLVLPGLFVIAVFRFAKDMKIFKDLTRGLTVK